MGKKKSVYWFFSAHPIGIRNAPIYGTTLTGRQFLGVVDKFIVAPSDPPLVVLKKLNSRLLCCVRVNEILALRCQLAFRRRSCG